MQTGDVSERKHQVLMPLFSHAPLRVYFPWMAGWLQHKQACERTDRVGQPAAAVRHWKLLRLLTLAKIQTTNKALMIKCLNLTGTSLLTESRPVLLK